MYSLLSQSEKVCFWDFFHTSCVGQPHTTLPNCTLLLHLSRRIDIVCSAHFSCVFPRGSSSSVVVTPLSPSYRSCLAHLLFVHGANRLLVARPFFFFLIAFILRIIGSGAVGRSDVRIELRALTLYHLMLSVLVISLPPPLVDLGEAS